MARKTTEQRLREEIKLLRESQDESIESIMALRERLFAAEALVQAEKELFSLTMQEREKEYTSLFAENHVNNALIDDLKKKLEAAEKRADDPGELSQARWEKNLADKKVQDLTQELSDLRVKHHQLIGYCDRVREEDAMRETGAPIVPDKPPAPPEGWYRRGGPWTSYTAKG